MKDKDMMSTLSNLVLLTILITLIYFANIIFKFVNYSLFSFAIFSVIANIICFILCMHFISYKKYLKN